MTSLGLSKSEIQARKYVLEATMGGHFTVSGYGPYPKSYWTDSADGYICSVNKSPSDALNSLWNEQGKWGILCDKLSKLEIERGYQVYCDKNGLKTQFDSIMHDARDVVSAINNFAYIWDDLEFPAIINFNSLGLKPGDEFHLKALGNPSEGSIRGSNVFYLYTDIDGNIYVANTYGYVDTLYNHVINMAINYHDTSSPTPKVTESLIEQIPISTIRYLYNPNDIL
jgi:hypothetical protein